jgi:serine/threonine protein kinase
MGVVYKAVQESLQRPVALKTLAPDVSGNDAFRRRFLREARLAASLDHPHVVPVYEAGELQGRLFIAERFVDGPDLDELLRWEGRLEPVRSVRLLGQIAGGLDAAHARGLIHRDVKPANILIAQSEVDEHAYLCDFGLAKGGGETSRITRTGELFGTVDYIAPEYLQTGEALAATDIYALGCVLFQTLTGSPPFKRDSEIATIRAHLTETPRDVSALVPGLPTALDAAIARSLAKDPSERFASAGELADAARRSLSERTP